MASQNRLIHETSPYLLQHAHNPVDWYPWGDEALQTAKVANKPIFLSIGYSACHWCHVMEKECFENSQIAVLMNDKFINIKVDREERPDIDSIYMHALQSMNGQGGWPLNMFLTPDCKPFYGGTYFPPSDRRGMPGFPRVLNAIAASYESDNGEILTGAEKLLSQMEKGILSIASKGDVKENLLSDAFKQIQSSFDMQDGGFGQPPKFPQPLIPEFLLRYYHRTKDDAAINMVEVTLDRMADGGIHDQIGGGFHRYSTDGQWLVPHFEKMLYDNALLVQLYLHAFQVTQKNSYRKVVEETLDYLIRDMKSESGAFYSSQDADSEGEEGKYFVWSAEQVAEILGSQDSEIFCKYYGISHSGNFEGKNILNVPRSFDVFATENGVDKKALRSLIDKGKENILKSRYGRVAPETDQKVLSAWNGMMIKALSEAGVVLGRDDYLDAARSCASFILTNIVDGTRLKRSFKDGIAKFNGYLEDYSQLINGLIALHEATLDVKWLIEAKSLTDRMISLFWSDGQGLFYDTGIDHEKLLIRPRDIFDNAVPCGSSTAVEVLLRLGLVTGNKRYEKIGKAGIESIATWVASHPLGFGNWLSGIEFYLSIPKEISIVGEPEDQAVVDMLKIIHNKFLPNKVVIGKSSASLKETMQWPLFDGKEKIDNKVTAYVCENYSCKIPATDTELLASQLD